MVKANRPPMTPLDYLFMIGGPLFFMAFAIFGIYWLIGPAPPENPVQMVKDGKVVVGMSQAEVERILGAPKSKSDRLDGGELWQYHHGTADPFVEEDADLAFSPGGRLLSATVSKSPIPIPTETPAPK